MQQDHAELPAYWGLKEIKVTLVVLQELQGILGLLDQPVPLVREDFKG